MHNINQAVPDAASPAAIPVFPSSAKARHHICIASFYSFDATQKTINP